MDSVIKIAPVSQDARIGSLFGHVFKVLFMTEQTNFDIVDKVVWDFSECTYLHPFYLAALGVLLNQYRDRVTIAHVSDNLRNYFDNVYFEKPLEISDTVPSDLSEIYGCKTYVPICKFYPKKSISSDAVQKIVQDTLKTQIGRHTMLHQILSLSLGELVDNISDHSCSETGFVFSQYIAQEKVIYLFIADTGQSIYTSFATDERYVELLDRFESSALQLALTGKSTKNRPENENRGYGISRTRKIIVEALGGAFFVLSGGAFFRDERGSNDTIVDLPDDIRWDGTVILLKIPTVIPDGFNIYDYIG